MAEARATSRFLDRTLRNLRSAWHDIAESARGLIPSSSVMRPELAGDDLARLRGQRLECLESRGGEVSARARAAELGRLYLSLSAEGRKRFLGLLAHEFDIDREDVAAACEALRTANGLDAQRAAERRLRVALE